VRVFVREIASEGLLDALRQGTIDFAVVQAVPPEPDLRVEPLLDDPVVAIAPRAIIPRRRTSIGLEELAATAPPARSGHVWRQFFNEEMRRCELAYDCNYDCINSLTLIAMAETGLRIAILPRSVLSFGRGSTTQAIAVRQGSLSRKIALISRSDRLPSPAASRLAVLISEQVAQIS
jgi:LysR family hydrogen peroxide-inducible transcriptional activator